MKANTLRPIAATLRCAIYARKSTSDDDRAVGDKSVERQVAHARAFAESKGWIIDDAHVYVDDAVSGAEFSRRPGLQRLLASLPERGRPPFDVLVLSEHSRLGRDHRNTAATYGRIIEAGVKVYFYLSGEQLSLDTDEEEVMLSLRGYGSAVERSKAVLRARDAALKRAREGRNFGGRCYGYANVWRYPDGREEPGTTEDLKPRAAATIYRINEAEAGVVRGIFEAYAAGYGAKMITYALNGNPAQADILRQHFGGRRPAPPRGNAGMWSSNTVHDMLRNPRYRGFIPFGATKKKYIAGTERRIAGDEQLFAAPDLRIIDEELAQAVQRRIDANKRSYLRSTDGKLHGRPETGRASHYLLSGLVRCEACGGAMIVSSYWNGSGTGRRQVRCYVCTCRSNRGPTACTNAARPRMEGLDHEVLAAIERHVLTPNVVRAAVQRAAELVRAARAKQPNAAARLRHDVGELERELENLVGALAAGGTKPATVLSAIADRERRIEGLRRELAKLESAPLLDELADKRLERQLAERAAHWREVLAGDAPLARQALRALMAGPIWFTPQANGYRLRGATRIGALWPEVGETHSVKLASPRGFEPRLPP